MRLLVYNLLNVLCSTYRDTLVNLCMQLILSVFMFLLLSSSANLMH